MNTHLTEIAFILDRSGSMAAMHDVAVEGLMEFLFLSSDLKAIDLAETVGIQKAKTVLFAPTREGNRRAHKTSIDYINEMKGQRRRRDS